MQRPHPLTLSPFVFQCGAYGAVVIIEDIAAFGATSLVERACTGARVDSEMVFNDVMMS